MMRPVCQYVKGFFNTNEIKSDAFGQDLGDNRLFGDVREVVHKVTKVLH